MTRLRNACVLAVAILAGGATSPATALTIVGTASVVDGDTVRIHDTSVRLHGIDAPESNQLCSRLDGSRWRCGQQAAMALDAHIARRPLSCEPRDTDRYGRVVAECFVAGESINRWTVRNGWAVAYRRFGSAYIPDEAHAKAAGLNIWSGTFDTPEEHRRRGQGSTTAAARPPAAASRTGCTVKGNISSKGERIFHVTGQRDYASVAINERQGERWFCSPADAIKAGWRAAKR